MAVHLLKLPKTNLPVPLIGGRYSSTSTNLKDVLAGLIPQHQKTVKEFRQKYGNTKIGNVTVDMMYGGMRGIKGLVTETSVLDPLEGIRFRGYSIPECQKLLPKAPGGEEPLPEGIFWLLSTGQIPNKDQTRAISKEWASRADLPPHVVSMLNNFPSNLHPMAQFSAAITACNSESKFAKAYASGINKAVYWEYVYEDTMDLIAKLPTIAAIIYHNLYRDGASIGPINLDFDWSANFTSMLGFEDPGFTELMRLYLTLLADHEGGNVCAHTCHTVASALSDPFISLASGMNGLAGPLHGLASQTVFLWLTKVKEQLPTDYDEQTLRDFIWNTLKSGQVIPGYGHAVLRKTDPRFTSQREFSLKHMPKDSLSKLASDIYKVAPEILLEQGKAKNPWPNVDAYTGVLFHYYGMKETHFYTVLVGVSRALGCLSSMIWDRALGLPIARPKSMRTEELIKDCEK